VDSEVQRHLQAALAEPPLRVRPLVLGDGRRYWLKRVERLAGAMRLQKGDPARAFAAERDGLHALAEAGLPVAAIAEEGPDWVLMPDAGPVLPTVIADKGRSEADKRAACTAAGRALGRLHWAGMVHGRPAVRDICWDGQEARFIDLERFRAGRRSGLWQAADVVMFVQTAYTQWPDDIRWLEAALAAYAANAPPGAMARVRRLSGWLAPLGWLAAALLPLRPKGRELRAARLTLSRLRRG
jgi:tRNA A-37 threonylcarbamoyl transferase component Bud32